MEGLGGGGGHEFRKSSPHRNTFRVVGNLPDSCLKSKRSAPPLENCMLCPNRSVISSKASLRESMLCTWIPRDPGGNPSSPRTSHVDISEFLSVISTALNKHQELCSPGIVRAEPECMKALSSMPARGSGEGQADLEMRCPRTGRDYPPPGPSPGSCAEDSRGLFGVLFLLFSEDVCPWEKQ